eukprot:scaffold13_cov377-Prasinococcus_capsulatus_cf.AAC.26
MLRVEATHELARATHHTDGHAASAGLAIDDHVCLHAKLLLATTRSDSEATIYFVEDQWDIALGAHPAQILKPFLVGHLHLLGCGRLADIGRRHGHIVGRGRIGVEHLQRVHDHASNFAASSRDALQGGLIHVLQHQAVPHDSLVPGARLNTIPPPVGPLRVEAGEAHSAHHGFCAGHIEGDFVQAGNLLENADVVHHQRMHRAKDRSDILHALQASSEELLVHVVATHVEAIRAANVERPVAIQIHECGALRAQHHAGNAEVLPHVLLEGERHAVCVCEAQVRKRAHELRALFKSVVVHLLKCVGKPPDARTPLVNDVLACTVAAEELLLVVGKRAQDLRARHNTAGRR